MSYESGSIEVLRGILRFYGHVNNSLEAPGKNSLKT